MAAIDDLMPFLTGPVTIACPRMILQCQDFEPDLVEGQGTFTILNDREFEYRLTGTPADLAHAMRVLNRAREAQYDVSSHFRLVIFDEEGREWSGGWTLPVFDIADDGWVFTGPSDGLIGDALSEATGQGAAEARFIIPRNHSASGALRRLVRTETAAEEWEAVRVIDVLGSPVTFRFDLTLNVLSISTPSTEAMPAHSAENWLGEPLRILFGQLVFPRLVERRFADGRSMVFVRRSPLWTRDSAWLALWDASDPATADQFFDLYGNLLTMVARTGLWGSHTVTSYFEEVIQAMRGSRWVWALTMAGSIEGIARILVPVSTRRPDSDQAAIDALVAHIHSWQGAQRLKEVACSTVGQADQMSALRGLRDLADQGVVTPTQVETWRRIRNGVMHGELVSNYSSAHGDQTLLDLANLLCALTREAAQRAVANTLEQHDTPIMEPR